MKERCPTCGARERRTTAQNALYWKLLNQISEQVRPGGLSYSVDTWHVYWKSRLLGCDDIRLPNGNVIVVPRSTTDLDVPAFSDYFAQVEAWAAERGVHLPDLETT